MFFKLSCISPDRSAHRYTCGPAARIRHTSSAIGRNTASDRNTRTSDTHHDFAAALSAMPEWPAIIPRKNTIVFTSSIPMPP